MHADKRCRSGALAGAAAGSAGAARRVSAQPLQTSAATSSAGLNSTPALSCATHQRATASSAAKPSMQLVHQLEEVAARLQSLPQQHQQPPKPAMPAGLSIAAMAAAAGQAAALQSGAQPNHVPSSVLRDSSAFQLGTSRAVHGLE